MNVIAVIPAYNEEPMIADVINRTKKYVDSIIVVDDCSTDRTVSIIKKLKVRYLVHNKNYGAGKSTSDGIDIALKNDADIIVTLDSDGQHNPSEIPWLLKPILDNEADIVIGSRFIGNRSKEQLGYGMIKIPKYRRFVNWCAALLYNIGHKEKISDSQCCFRAFTRKSLNIATITDKGFGLTIEPLVKARKYGLRIVEVPVSRIYHSEFKLNSSMNPFKQAIISTYRLLYWRLKLWN
jgi:glycosyltransferase involved in cell wall biosynthesis